MPLVPTTLAISASRRGRPSVKTFSNLFSSRRIVCFDIEAVGREFRVGLAHFLDDDANQLMQERLGQAEVLAVAHRPPHDLAQHVAAFFVRRNHAVGDEECGRPDVVGDNPHRDAAAFVCAIPGAGKLADPPQNGHEDVGVVIRLLVLQHGRDALEAHAGVDRRGRQGRTALHLRRARTP